jgi:hypothetical protein
MSFRLFIYYSALGGGWAAFLAWAVVQGCGMRGFGSALLRASLVGGMLGLLVAAAIGTVDGILNSVGFARVLRVLVSMVVGCIGGLLGAGAGQLLAGTDADSMRFKVLLVVGWMLTGVFVGASIGIYDLLRAGSGGGDMRIPLKKTLNGVLGGLLGGLVGGLPFGILARIPEIRDHSDLAIALPILGTCIGLMVALAQVFLKEAWLKVERGFRAGRELLLSKDETVIGRAESCDVGIFGDMDIEKEHARIVLEDGHYVLHDNKSARGTYLNDKRISKPEELNSGDLIRVGNCYLRFGERTRRQTA